MITSGLHHISVFARDARRTRDFYTRTLGLRMVKQTVNYGDPGVHHLYFGDAHGRPGTILTFFPYDKIAPGRGGVGETEEIMLAVQPGAIGFWTHRLLEHGVPHEGPLRHFGQSVLRFRDPNGLRLSLVGMGDAPLPEPFGDIAPENAIAGLAGVRLMVEVAEPTIAVLRDVFGLVEAGSQGSITRLEAPGDALGRLVEVHCVGGFLKARPGAGSVHHIAFRARDDAAQAEMGKALAERHGLSVTEVKDRTYFRSIYAREPGYVLLEIATDGPGVTVDEPAEALGEALQLPAMYEPDRARIERLLPAL